MVDYFYKGYESFGITKGLTMLEQHINNPYCLTNKRQQIIKRLEGIKTIVVGSLSPNFILKDNDSSVFNFHAFKGPCKSKLLLFWSADCELCCALVKELSLWHNEADNKIKLDIIAVSLDETETEIAKWYNEIEGLTGWKHLHAVGGMNSEVANK